MKIILEYQAATDRMIRTYFIEKIMNGTKLHTIRSPKYSVLDYPVKARHKYVGVENYKSSLLTDITGFEELEIIHLKEGSDALASHGYSPILIVNNKVLSEKEALKLAQNDGFNSWYAFQKWFDADQSRVILHFKNLRYGSK